MKAGEKKYYEGGGREALAAAAMAFAPATDVPRERALIRSAILSVLLTFGDKEFKREEAVEAICGHGALPELRSELAGSLFDNLVSANIVKGANTDQGLMFRFDEGFANKTYAEQDRIESLIDRVIWDLFEDLPKAMKPQVRAELLAALARLMQEYGNQYAYQIAGRAEEPIVVQREELVGICRDTMSKDIQAHVKTGGNGRCHQRTFCPKGTSFRCVRFCARPELLLLTSPWTCRRVRIPGRGSVQWKPVPARYKYAIPISVGGV